VGQTTRREQRGRTSGIEFQQTFELAEEGAVALRAGIGGLEFLERRHQRLRDVAPAVGTETAGDKLT
jgi:hypothetical protein